MAHGVGLCTLPILATAACGFARLVDVDSPESAEAQARMLRGVITGVGFIGGGAIVRHGTDRRGLVTAASVWNAGAIGVAVGIERADIAAVRRAAKLASLWAPSRLRRRDPGGEDDG